MIMTFLRSFSMPAKIARSSRLPVTSSAEGESKIIIDQRTARRGDVREGDHGQQNGTMQL